MKDGLSSLLIGILLVVAAVGVFFYFNNSYAKGKGGPRIQSVANLQKIGLALRDYRNEHAERLPEKLSHLIPQYVAKTNLTIFYAPPQHAKTPRSLPDGWSTNPRLVDTHSSYAYLGADATNGVLVFEKPKLWETNTNSWMDQRLAVLFDDYRVELTPLPKLVRLLPRNNPWLGNSSSTNAPETNATRAN